MILVTKDPSVDHLLELADRKTIRYQARCIRGWRAGRRCGRNRGLGGGRHHRASLLPPSSQELLDRIIDPFLVADLGKGQVVLILEGLFELAVELARAVGALD